MGKLHWYKRDPNAALSGMMELTLEERGAYNTVLDLIYSHDGSVDDDERFLARWMGCDVRVWRRIRARLLELEKLYVDGGQLHNSRADREVGRGLSMVAFAAEAGRKSGAVRRKNKELARTNDELSTTTSRKKEESATHSLVQFADDWPPDFAEKFWSQYPRRIGKQAAVKALERVRKARAVAWATLMAGVSRYAAATVAVETQFVKHPATWINAGCWDDDPAALARAGPMAAPLTPREQKQQDWRNALNDLKEHNRRASHNSGGTAGGLLPEWRGERSGGFHDGVGSVVELLPPDRRRAGD